MIRSQLRRYIPMANMIAKTFGNHCEVVIHDLSMPQSSVVYAVNSHVTGRQVGQSFNFLIKSVLLSKDFADDYKANYFRETDDHKKIKTSTAFIRDENNKIIGAICINYELRQFQEMEDFLRTFLHHEEETEQKEVEPFAHVVEIVDQIIDQIIENADIEQMKRRKKIELIQFMDKKGIFLMKGSVDKVAEKLNISKVTVYSYLDEIRKNSNMEALE